MKHCGYITELISERKENVYSVLENSGSLKHENNINLKTSFFIFV